MTNYNLSLMNVITGLLVCFTPFGIAQISIYSDVQQLKKNDQKQEIYIERSGAITNAEVAALQEIAIDIRYIKNELAEQKQFRTEFEQKSDEFYQLNPQLIRPK